MVIILVSILRKLKILIFFNILLVVTSIVSIIVIMVIKS